MRKGYYEMTEISAFSFYKVFNTYRLFKILTEGFFTYKKNIGKYRILDAGCGTGRIINQLVELGADPKKCYGIDIDNQAIESAKKMSLEGVNYQVGSIAELPYEKEYFDIIICSGVFVRKNVRAEIDKVSKEFRRVLKSDGIVFSFEYYNCEWNTPEGREEHTPFRNTDELTSIMSDDFDFVRYFNGYKDVYDMKTTHDFSNIDMQLDTLQLEGNVILLIFEPH